jgi:hypothetical protein
MPDPAASMEFLRSTAARIGDAHQLADEITGVFDLGGAENAKLRYFNPFKFVDHAG